MKKFKKCNAVDLDRYYASIRYIPTSGSYIIRGYCQSIERLGDIKVLEVDLLRIIDKCEFSELEDLDNDSFADIKFIRSYYNLSVSSLLAARKQWHRKRLGRCLTSVVSLSRKADRESISFEWSQNLEIYPKIYRKAVTGGRYDMFEELNKEWCRYFKIPYKKTEWVNRYKELRSAIIEEPEYVNKPDIFDYQNECMREFNIKYN